MSRSYRQRQIKKKHFAYSVVNKGEKEMAGLPIQILVYRFRILPLSALSAMPCLHEYCTCVQTQMDIKVPHKRKGTQHTSQWDICMFFHWSEGRLSADLSVCHLCITNCLSISAASNLPGQLKIPWYNRAENGTEELSLC